MEVHGSVARLLTRLSDRARPPRSWWFPYRDDPALESLPPDRVQQDYLEVSSNIAKTVVTIIAFSFFCLFTLLGAPDRELIAAGAQITIPVAKVGVSFTGFLILGPLLLVAFFLHLHTFVAYWLSLGKAAEQPRRGAYVFNLPFTSTQVLSSLLFYWLVPVVLGVFAWKAAPQPTAGRLLFLTFIAVTAWSVWTQIRRADELKRWWNMPRWALMVAALLALLGSARSSGNVDLYNSVRSLRGGLQLQKADLTGQNLRGRFLEEADLTDALLGQANLHKAKLADAVLAGAKLNGADLSRADLRGVDLTGAVLNGADLSHADLRGVDLTGAALAPAVLVEEDSEEPESVMTATMPTNLEEAKLAGAVLVGADLTSANLSGAVLTDAKLGLATLIRADLDNAHLRFADLTHADLRGASLVKSMLRDATLFGVKLYATDDGTAADLTEATLMDAHMEKADLRQANLRDANLTGADVSDVDFTNTTNLTQDQLTKACLRKKPAILPSVFLEQPPPCPDEPNKP